MPWRGIILGQDKATSSTADSGLPAAAVVTGTAPTRLRGLSRFVAAKARGPSRSAHERVMKYGVPESGPPQRSHTPPDRILCDSFSPPFGRLVEFGVSASHQTKLSTARAEAESSAATAHRQRAPRDLIHSHL